MQRAAENSGKGTMHSQQSEEDLRLENIVARLREPLQDKQSQLCREEPACSPGQVRRVLLLAEAMRGFPSFISAPPLHT